MTPVEILQNNNHIHTVNNDEWFTLITEYGKRYRIYGTPKGFNFYTADNTDDDNFICGSILVGPFLIRPQKG